MSLPANMVLAGSRIAGSKPQRLLISGATLYVYREVAAVVAAVSHIV
jgi:hypothetical protein